MTDNEMLQEILAVTQSLKTDVQSLKTDMKSVKTDVQQLKADMQDTKHRITSLELTLENETNRNIRLIAEGHLDLSRKLDQALVVENQKEMLLIRVNTLENEMRKLKEQMVRTS